MKKIFSAFVLVALLGAIGFVTWTQHVPDKPAPEPIPAPEPLPTPEPQPDIQPAPPPPPVQQPTPVPSPPAASKPPFVKGLACDIHKWLPEWDDIVAQAVDDYGPDLLDGTKVKDEIVGMCPGYFTASSPERHAFWALFVASVAKPESCYKPDDAYMESFGVYSDGLLQVSYSDYPRHPNCELRRKPGTTEAQNLGNAFDPRPNLRCGVAILNTQVRTGKGLTQNGKSYYWSTLNKRFGGYVKVMAQFNKYVPQLAFCGKPKMLAPMVAEIESIESMAALKKATHSAMVPEARAP